MTPKLRVAVIGCGVLGTRHAQIYHKLPDAELVAVCDRHPDRAQKLAQSLGVDACDKAGDLIGRVEAASICTPAGTHYQVARKLLEGGLHLLVEKPLTTDLAEADELLKIARRKNLKLQTGHVERFNAAVRVIKGTIKDPQFIECDRIGPYDARITDVGVVLDLMIHDIDILLHLVKSRVKRIGAIGLSMMSETEDFANARIEFQNGTVASLTASRMARDRLRKIRIFQDDAYISLDYRKQEADILTRSDGTTEYRTIEIRKSEPLREELHHFVDCVRGRAEPTVSGEDGRAALAVALRILSEIRSRETLPLSS